MARGQPKPSLTPRQRELLSNSTNVAILVYLIQRPATLMEVADAHQLIPMEANFRLRQLGHAGLISSSLREGLGVTSERVFQAAMDDVELSAHASADTMANGQQVQLILNHLKRDLTYHALHPDEGKVHVRCIGIRTSPANFERWLAKVKELEREFDAEDDDAETSWYFLAFAMYSAPEREPK